MKLKLPVLLGLIAVLSISCQSSRSKPAKRKPASIGPVVKFNGFAPKLVWGGRDPQDIPESTREIERTQKVTTCLREMCGKEDQNFTYMDAISSQENRYIYREGNPFYQKVDTLLRQGMRDELTGKLEEYQIIDWLAQSNNFTPSPMVIRLVNFIEIISIWSKAIAALSKSGVEYTTMEQYYRHQFTASDLQKLNIKPESQALFLKAQQYGFLPDYASNTESDDELPLRLYLAKNYPNLEFAAALKEALTKCFQKDQHFYEGFGLGQFYSQQSYCGHLLKSPNEPVDEARLMEDLSGMGGMDLIFSDVYAELLGQWTLNLPELAKTLLASDSFKKKRQGSETLVTKNLEDIPEFNTTLETCHKNIGNAREVAGSPLIHARWDNLIKAIKNKTLELIRFRDANLQTEFQKRVNQAEFAFPGTAKNLEKYVLERLQSEVQGNKLVVEALKSNPKFKQNFALFSLTSTLGKEGAEKSEEDKLFKDAEALCKAYASETLSDHMYSAKGASFLSWVTLIKPEYGIGIASHEMGHYVSNILSTMGESAKGSYYWGLPEKILVWETRRCVNKMHTQTDTAGKENQWAEEDWADAFSGRLTRMMLKENSWIKNFGCVLNADIFNLYYDDSKQNINDSHSNAFLRAVHIETLLKGTLPPACKNLREAAQICR